VGTRTDLLASFIGMTDLDEHSRPEPPLVGDETAAPLGFLDFRRATLAWKCGGLEPSGLRATVGLTLGGSLKHRAYVEDHCCTGKAHMIEEYARGTTAMPTFSENRSTG
jgi:hypothetical protein